MQDLNNAYSKNPRNNSTSRSYNQQGFTNINQSSNPEGMDNEWNNLRSGSSHTFRNANKSNENNSFSSMNKKSHVMDQGNWRKKEDGNSPNYRNNNFNSNEMNTNMNSAEGSKYNYNKNMSSSDNSKYGFSRNYKNSHSKNTNRNNSLMKNASSGISAKGVNKNTNNNSSNTNNGISIRSGTPSASSNTMNSANGVNIASPDNYTNSETMPNNQNNAKNSNQNDFTNMGGNFNNNFSNMNNKAFYESANKNNKFTKSDMQSGAGGVNFSSSPDGKKNINYKNNQYSGNFKNEGSGMPNRNINMDEANQNIPAEFNPNMNYNSMQTKYTTLIENTAESKNANSMNTGFNNPSSNLNNSAFYKQKYENNDAVNGANQGKNEYLPYGGQGANNKYYAPHTGGNSGSNDGGIMNRMHSQNDAFMSYDNQNKKGNMYSSENANRNRLNYAFNANAGNMGHMGTSGNNGYPEMSNPSGANRSGMDATHNFYPHSSGNPNFNNPGSSNANHLNSMAPSDNANFTKRECLNVDNNYYAPHVQNQGGYHFENAGGANTNVNFNAQSDFGNKGTTSTFNNVGVVTNPGVNSNPNLNKINLTNNNAANSTNFFPGATGAGRSTNNNPNMNSADSQNVNNEEEDNDDWGELGEDKYIDINSIIKKKNVILNQLADLNMSKKGKDNKNKKKAKGKKDDEPFFLTGADASTSLGEKKKNKKNKNKNAKGGGNNKEKEKEKEKENESGGKNAKDAENGSNDQSAGKNKGKKGNVGSETDSKMNEGSTSEDRANETNDNACTKKDETNELDKNDDSQQQQNGEKKEITEKPAKAIYVFKRKENMSPLEYMERQIKSLLNKLTVENFPIITEKMCQIMDSRTNTDEIQTVVNEVINKAVLEHDWSEMYADVCQALKWRSPNFEMKKKSSFEIALLKKIQEEYENLPSTFESTMKEKLKNDENEEELSFVEQKQKKRLFGIVKLIGELFQRQIVSISIVISIAHDLLIAFEEPKEYCIEAFLQLIYSTGFFIDKMEKYKNILDTWFGRLKELQRKKMYSKRIKFVIQDVFDLRLSEWRKKTHKDTAKGLNELRSQLETEEMMGGSIHLAQLGNIVIVGERHNIRNNESYSKYMQEQERLSKANQKK
ncbi:asparagine-rich protein [Plasmodium cynomolgi strain B]|uniref:Asparagine-rich protein n=1 Tax=Plasmodium cynomolgi (strain B) TaxID=1120755 RepID=K6V120_PLACD|nr:asparagine-rich protein [Plasmodium cynomolgi strain B]GAB68795.1 asparagine-rich protein [Plasmodium cynomolgi strain B]